jgi:hypothetical protein
MHAQPSASEREVFRASAQEFLKRERFATTKKEWISEALEST